MLRRLKEYEVLVPADTPPSGRPARHSTLALDWHCSRGPSRHPHGRHRVRPLWRVWDNGRERAGACAESAAHAVGSPDPSLGLMQLQRV